MGKVDESGLTVVSLDKELIAYIDNSKTYINTLLGRRIVI